MFLYVLFHLNVIIYPHTPWKMPYIHSFTSYIQTKFSSLHIRTRHSGILYCTSHKYTKYSDIQIKHHIHTNHSYTTLPLIHYFTSEVCTKYYDMLTLTQTYTQNTLTHTSDNQNTLIYKKNALMFTTLPHRYTKTSYFTYTARCP